MIHNSKLIPVNQHNRGKFNTHTGQVINIADPDPDEITIEDISTALSRICRFGGHSSCFYSVAQHSCLVAAMVPEKARKAALLHDASEAYLGDVIKPLKVMLGDCYTSIEDRFTTTIFRKFSILNSYTGDDYNAIKLADIEALELEHEALILGKPARLASKLDDYNLATFGWAWDQETSKTIFLKTFEKLFN